MPYRKDYIVYALIDPRSHLVRYIGKSTRGMSRVAAHRRCDEGTTGPYSANWVRSLKAIGLEFDVAVLERLPEPGGLAEAERWWIAYGKLSAWPLTNLTDGGDGVLNPTAEVRAKISARFKGVPCPPETRAKISASLAGKSLTEEHRRKVGEASKGRRWKPETYTKFSAARAGFRHSAETRKKISDAQKGRKQSEARIQKRVASQKRRWALQPKLARRLQTSK